MKAFKIHIILVLVALTSSFVTKADTTDNYQIFIKNKLVFNESGVGSAIKKVNLLVLKKHNYNDSLFILFNHCSPAAEKRKIQLVDSTQRVVLEWNFKDQIDEDSMVISIKQIWQQSNVPFLTLYYFDSYIPKGTFISLIAFEDHNLAKVISTYKTKFKNY